MMEESEPGTPLASRNDTTHFSSYHTPVGRKGTPQGIYNLSFASIVRLDDDMELTGADDDCVEEIDLHSDMHSHLRTSGDGNSSSLTGKNDDPAIMEYRFGRVNDAKRYLKSFSLQRPRVYGALLVCVTLVIPLLIIIIVQSTFRYSNFRNKIPGSTGIFTPSTETKDTVTWETFSASSKIAAVATDHAECSLIAKNIMVAGGNAVDAAIAATLCLGVVSPASSGIGGGCYILTHNGTTLKNEFIDSREFAPKGSTFDMFKENPMQAQDGGKAIAVFSELKGLHMLWTLKGSLPWAALVTPAATLAYSWTIDNEVALLLLEIKTQLRSGLYPLLSALYIKPDGTLKIAGDTVQQPVLASTLLKVATLGPEYLYSTMASTIATEIQAAGGIISAEDITSYVPLRLDPLSVTFMGGSTYVGASGSSSGGASVAGVLSFMGGYPDPVAAQGELYKHRLVEAFKHIFAIRMSLADPLFVNVTGPLGALMSRTYMSSLRNITSDTSVLPLDKYGGKFNAKYNLKTDHGTTHLSVVDKKGNAVGITSTVNTYFGSKVISPSTGILFNNQMDDFSIPGSPNFFGLAPSPLNYPDAFKRPLSSMSPSFVLDKKGRVRLVGGGSGGPKIITATVQTILNYVGFGMDLLCAIKAPRVHSQLMPPVVHVENHTLFSGLTIRNDASLYTYLQSTGHNTTQDTVLGYTQFIGINQYTGYIEAVSDPRKDGRPYGL